MGEITYVRGDATTPSGKGVKVIAHVCNDLGGWGKGFVLALSRRWPEPEKAYRAWHRDRANNDFGLGAVQLVQVERYIWVANMIGQRGTRTGSKGVPVRYEAIDAALAKLADEALERGASVHMPRIGCGLAGGKWSRIEPLIAERLVGRGVAVTVHDHGESAPL
ncbi:macro domain-containing protein [Streptomyces sp900105755]|uniref:macro domain-containing protein n=1 Tax=Streptomyces sp. 900105755 TaxID=3154389 RepID=UPI003322F1C8